MTRISMLWALAMVGLLPVARIEEPSSVPRNQYIRKINARANSPAAKIAVSVIRREMNRSYLSTLTATLARLPIICRFTEYRAIWVRMPDRMGAMPKTVCRSPVTRPAARAGG